MTFEENDNPADSVYAVQTENTPTPLTIFSSLNPSFIDTGYVFSDWNTQANGSGTTYSDGETYNFSADLVLYAQWKSTYHAVTLYENAGPSDPIYASQTSDTQEPLTFFSQLSPSFENAGFTFEGWNTQPGGGGTSYSDGASYSFTSDLSLYAQWTADPTVSVSFAANGAQGTVSALSGAPGASVTIPGGSSLTFPNDTFTGWNSQANGGGTAYLPGVALTLSTSITLYAQWVANSFIVTFDASGGTVPVPVLQFTAGGVPVSLPSATLAGSTFEGWYTAPTGGSLVGEGGASYTPTESLTLYAQWSAAQSFTVDFSANGGSGTAASLSVASGKSVTLPTDGAFIRPGYTQVGWGTSSSGGTVYPGGGQFTPESSMTLYAQWDATKAVATFYGAVGDFVRFGTSLTPALDRQVMSVARAVAAKSVTRVELYGYTASTGLESLDRSISTRRAEVVARQLRVDLRRLHIKGVAVAVRGEGSIDRRTAAEYSRVEVFFTQAGKSH